MQRSIEPTLLQWKDQPHRQPLIIRGARQVGKSFIVEKFGLENFENLVTCNFEFRPELVNCFKNLDPQSICTQLEIAFQTKITPGKTLLFLDEIQSSPNAITSLRYFKEKMPRLHVIAAGSLLEFKLHEEKFSFPVGRVQFLYMRPLSFYEYLLNSNHHILLNRLENVHLDNPLEPFIHEELLKLVREYFLIGGMPAVVNSYLTNKSLLDSQNILSSLLETYRSDFPKYAKSTHFKYLQLVFEKVPSLVCKNFKYSHISHEYRSADLKQALDQLNWAGLIYKVRATSASGIPLTAQAKEHKFKLLFLDLGLMNSAHYLDLNIALHTELMQINSGIQAEQFVGQELLAYSDYYMNTPLYFWERDKQGAQAEVDYVIQVGSNILPIEVKAGTTGSLKSMSQFLLEKKAPFGIRISQHPISFHNRVLSIPLYLLHQLPRLIKLTA